MTCASQCYVIGGPWIAEDPDCPIHGRDAQRREREQAEQEAAKDARITQLEADVQELKTSLRRLRSTVGRKLDIDLDD